MSNIPPVFRVSYSILNSWSRGYAQDAIDMYFKLPREENEFMRQGKMFHESWEKYINTHKKLHPQLTRTDVVLADPKCELKMEAMITDTIQLVGVIDCLDCPTIYEFKSGVKSASEYAETMQHPVYALLCQLNGHEVNKVRYYHFNQYDKTSDTSLIWITPKMVEKGRAWLTEQATSMYTYLVNNGYYDKYETPNHSASPDTPVEEAVL